MTDDVDFEGLELIEMRLPIDVDKLLKYLEANSNFPAGSARVLQFNNDLPGTISASQLILAQVQGEQC